MMVKTVGDIMKQKENVNADEIVISESRRSKAFASLAYPYS